MRHGGAALAGALCSFGVCPAGCWWLHSNQLVEIHTQPVSIVYHLIRAWDVLPVASATDCPATQVHFA